MKEFHPIANCWPLMEGEDFDKLVADISENGLHHPIMQFEDKVIDGRNRDRACDKAGVEPRYETFTGTYAEAVKYAASMNNTRRHLTLEERSLVAANLMNLEHGGNRKSIKGSGDPLISAETAASLMDVSKASVKRAKAITKAPPEVRPQIEKAVKTKKVSLANGAEIARSASNGKLSKDAVLDKLFSNTPTPKVDKAKKTKPAETPVRPEGWREATQVMGIFNDLALEGILKIDPALAAKGVEPHELSSTIKNVVRLIGWSEQFRDELEERKT